MKTLLSIISIFVVIFVLGFFTANAQEANSEDDLDSKIKRGEKLIRELNEKIEGTPSSNPAVSEARKLFNDARDAINAVHPELASGRRDKALENATNAVNLALSAINKIDDTETDQLVSQDESVTPQDLGVGDPFILPGNPLYALKGLARGFQSFMTRDPATKAELKIKFANEKLIEARKLEEGGSSDDRIKNAVESYRKESEQVGREVEKLKNFADETRIEEIVGNLANAQIKHHRALGKIMKERDEIAPDIEEAKTEAMKRFSQSMADVVEPEVMRQKFEQAIEGQRGSSFRHFKNIGVLEEVKGFVPEQAQSAIQNAIEQSSRFFEEDFNKAEEGQRKLFNKYIERIGGNEVRHLGTLDTLNSFADINEEMFEEMEKAREKTRKRVEERMKGIKDETRKQVFVAHLEDASLEDARIVKELENNLDPGTISSILEIKQKMDQKMRERFENAQSSDDLNDFFGEIEQNPDVRMMEVLKEMDGVIPEDKREFWQEMKEKAMSEMQGQIEQARQFGRLEEELRRKAGFDPEQLGIIDEFENEFGGKFGFFQDIKREHAERVSGRFDHFEEFIDERPDNEEFFERGEHFKARFEENPAIKENFKAFIPAFENKFIEFEKKAEQINFEGESLEQKIRVAQEKINILRQKLSEAPSDSPGRESAQHLLDNATSNLSDAQSALANAKQGEAFGKATSAIQLAGNGLRKLDLSAFSQERREHFDERDEFIKGFRDLPPEERPDFRDFKKFEFKPRFLPHEEVEEIKEEQQERKEQEERFHELKVEDRKVEEQEPDRFFNFDFQKKLFRKEEPIEEIFKKEPTQEELKRLEEFETAPAQNEVEFIEGREAKIEGEVIIEPPLTPSETEQTEQKVFEQVQGPAETKSDFQQQETFESELKSGNELFQESVFNESSFEGFKE